MAAKRVTSASYQALLPLSGSISSSANVTTPIGHVPQARIGGIEAAASTSFGVTQESSVEPPPMSTISATSVSGSNRLAQPSTESRASSSAVMIVELQSEILLDAIEKHLPVRCGAARLRGDAADSHRIARFDPLRAGGESLIGAPHRAVAQAAGVREAFAKPHDARKSVDNFAGRRRRPVPPSTGGNCWCPDRAPRTVGARGRGPWTRAAPRRLRPPITNHLNRSGRAQSAAPQIA